MNHMLFDLHLVEHFKSVKHKLFREIRAEIKRVYCQLERIEVDTPKNFNKSAFFRNICGRKHFDEKN